MMQMTSQNTIVTDIIRNIADLEKKVLDDSPKVVSIACMVEDAWNRLETSKDIGFRYTPRMIVKTDRQEHTYEGEPVPYTKLRKETANILGASLVLARKVKDKNGEADITINNTPYDTKLQNDLPIYVDALKAGLSLEQA